MSYSIELTENFKKEAKRLIKKYPSSGNHLGNDIYKIRLAIKSKGKGKSGGARVMTQVKVVNQTVYMFSIYDKSEKDSISDSEIKELIKDIPES